jgi:hypothetical protein
MSKVISDCFTSFLGIVAQDLLLAKKVAEEGRLLNTVQRSVYHNNDVLLVYFGRKRLRHHSK